ncbi:MAG: AmmeMemoRadiSam system radical SAM enzyme [Acidobacteriota bacterium]|nr:AmmeMemoRadiSam system radical SAM enzyme [Acidobacteriota bacterium]
MRRRSFLGGAAGVGLALGTGAGKLLAGAWTGGESPSPPRTEARYYKKLPGREVLCGLCPRACLVADKERGFCGVRQNIGGTYYSLVYGKVCALNVDPIEKKPFFHVLPKTDALSLATAGCNFHCKFCQNWEISQSRPEQVEATDLSPRAAAEAALRHGCPSIAFTYSEPTVFYEYMSDTAAEARKRGLKSVVVSNGHINPEPLRALTEKVDAIKIDLKAFRPEFYRTYVRGELDPVLESIRIVRQSGVWLEIVYLVIPTLNDGEAEIRDMSRWMAGEIGPDVPVHFSRFQPMYLLKNLPPTPVATLEAARRTALAEGLRYVYVGNVPGHEGENTYCPKCRTAVIERSGFEIRANRLKGGACPNCRTPIPGLWA